MRPLVTRGGGGFLGSHVDERLGVCDVVVTRRVHCDLTSELPR
jgi:hypothetical protein